MNRTHITSFHIAILLLQILHCLNSIHSSKGKNADHEEQQETEQTQRNAFTSRIQPLLLLSFAAQQI